MRSRAPVRLLLVLLAAVVAVSAFAAAAPAEAASTFDDTGGSVYDEAVAALAEAGVVEGCGNGNFCPTDSITRGQLASFIARALNLPDAGGDHFTDDDGGEHESAINSVAEVGITRGCKDGRFCPGQVLDREQMAALLSRAFELSGGGTRYFADVRGMHAGAIRRIAAEGITAGCEPARYCPDDAVLRGQMALFLGRGLGHVDAVDPVTYADYQAQQEAARKARRRRADARERLRIWERLAQCESGGRWSINTGNGFYGGLQFSLSSWRGVGGSGYPHQHSKAEQIRRGEILQSRQGWGAWPHCSRKLGLR